MDEQGEKIAPQTPAEGTQHVPPEPVKEAPQVPKRPIILWLLVALAVALVWLFASRNLNRFGLGGTEPTPTTTLTETTPTPALTPAPLATESAYMVLQGTVASLSAQISASVVTDATLNPPVINLPLGFTPLR